MISPQWSFMKDSVTPKPDSDERVLTKAWVERGLSLPCSEFFLSVLTTYGLQPHNICPNSYLLLSNFVTLCEGHLGIRPDIRLRKFFFRVKKETKDKAMVNCGSMNFMLRPGRMYPPHSSHESVRYWNAGWFYVKNIPVPGVHEGLPKFINKPLEELDSWSLIPLDTLAEEYFRAVLRVPTSAEGAEEVPEDDDKEEEKAPKRAAPRPAKRPRAKVSGSEAGASGEASAKKAKIKPPPLDSKKAERERLKLLANAGKGSRRQIPGVTSQKAPASQVNTQKQITKYLRASPVVPPITPTPPNTSHPTPHAPPHEAQHSPDPAAQAPPKIIPDLLGSMMNNAWGKADAESSEIQLDKKEIGDFFDHLLITRKEQQALHYELNKNISLQRRVTLSHAEDIQAGKERIAELEQQLAEAQEPLGYEEDRCNKFPREDLIRLAGDDYNDLISASRNICHNLNIKDSRTCDIRGLIKRMDLLPELVADLQALSSRGAAQMALTMCLAHSLGLDIDLATTGVPPNADVDALLDACSGYDTRIARRTRHDQFFERWFFRLTKSSNQNMPRSKQRRHDPPDLAMKAK
ncbi:hypothetical protein QYE76_044245 [Lolium multiflorum]|uniref:Transposase (putative) gypsy type domain-containing protein n=1 Tax=Lolium multiflorum TaxID=4521 RepID=A0AAD8TKB9_LOLMU|nr:hypothetical protein QYE76_044245 [Lolium multiflorum]